MNKNYPIGELPIWQGTQSKTDLRTHPFVLQIDNMGLIRLDYTEINDHLVQEYSSDDYHFISTPPGASEWGNKLAKRNIEDLVKLYGSLEGVNVIEIGGGTLYAAEYMLDKLHAKTVTLVDPAVQGKSTNNNLYIKREYFSKDTVLETPAQLVVSFNAIEHVPDPVGFLRSIRNKLTDDGALYLKMPDCEAGFKLGDLGICVHEHLSYFTQTSIKAVLGYVGLECIAEAKFHGSMQILVKKSEPDNNSSCDEGDFLLDSFSEKVNAQVEKLKQFGKEHQGEKVAFIGASVGLCNILNLSGIENLLTVGIFDSDLLKKGTFLPGSNVEIRHIEDAELDQYPHIFIVPSNFYKEIKTSIDQRFGESKKNIYPVFTVAGNECND